jgi:hypothetical protein
MRPVHPLITSLLALASLACLPELGRSDQGPAAERDPDHRLFELVLLDLANEGNRTLSTRAGRTKVLLDRKSLGDVESLDQEQLNNGLARRQTVPEDVGNSLRARNAAGPTSLASFKSTSPKILVGDLSEVPEGDDWQEEFEKRFPDAKGYIKAWLPGYSRDGRTAVLRFRVGPTPHGAVGTYFFEKSNGLWKVKWKHIIYFV